MGKRLLKGPASLIHLIRYRFLLFAGLLPFILGQAIAWNKTNAFHLSPFLTAFLGLVFVLIGVEAFNEYFDARIGTDRVFSLKREESPQSTFFVGLIGFTVAGIIMIILTAKLGWPVLVFAGGGAVAACFYVTPPIKLAYRGLGELSIVVSYGPMMTAGSYFVQTQRIEWAVFVASVVPALSILAVTVINEIPDFFGDRIVGKRNITVRLGRERAILLFGTTNFICLIFIVCGVLWLELPRYAWLAALPFPLAIRGFLLARHNYDNPQRFIPAIRGAVLTYSISVILLTVSYLV